MLWRMSTGIPLLALMEEVRSALVEHGATTATGYTARPGVEGKQHIRSPSGIRPVILISGDDTTRVALLDHATKYGPVPRSYISYCYIPLSDFVLLCSSSSSDFGDRCEYQFGL
jgi:hypothetical protein